MKKLFLVIALLFTSRAAAQNTTVSGTITDTPDGQAWFGGTLSFVFRVSPSNPTAQYFFNGVPFSSSQTISGALDASGHYSVSVPPNTSITPSGSTWDATFCPLATAQCVTYQSVTVTGATQTFAPAPPSIRINLAVPLQNPRAYTDSEVVNGALGQSYFNLTISTIKLCNFFPCGWAVISGGGGNPANPPGSVQINLAGSFGGGPQVSTVSIKPQPSDNALYVSPNGNDSNDGLSWGSAKLTVYNCLISLPGGSAGIAGGGTCRISSPVAYGGPAANQGMWIMGPGDVNFGSPPTGWLKKTTGAPINIECVLPALQYVNDHKSVCLMTGGGNSDLVHPAFWFSATTAINFKNVAFSNFLNTYGFIGIDSSGNRTGPGGTSQISLDGLSWNHGSCRFGGGPGIDIGSQSFWIWMRNINGTGCDFGELAIAAPGVPGLSRSGNVVTVTTTITNSISAGATQWITITNAQDPSFNGSFQVASTLSGTQFTYNQTGPNATSGNGQVVTSAKAAINMDSGGGFGTGLVFLDNFQINSGNIRYVPGLNGGGFYVRKGDYEGDGTNLDPPVVLVTAVTSPSNIVVEDVEISDAITPIPGVQIDNFNPSLIGAIVSRVDGGVKGQALILGGTPANDPTVSMLRSNQAGFSIAGRFIAGGNDVSRRQFGPVSIVSPNIAAINPSSWVFTVGTGTITPNIASPDNLTNAGRVTSNSGTAFVAFYNVGNVPITIGDAYIYGVWQRINAGTTAIGAPFFTLTGGGMGVGDVCTAAPGGITLFPQLSGDGQWIWMSGICKVGNNPTNAGINFQGTVANPGVIDFYGPTLVKIPAGTKSDNELYEIALNLSSYAATAVTGEVSLFPGQRLHHGTTTFANLGTPNNASDIYCTDCVANSNPCVGTGTGAFAQGINGAWVCGGGGGGGGCAPGGITDALQYNGGGTCSFGGVNSPTVNGNYNVHYRVTSSAAVPPAIDPPGVVINAQTGASYVEGSANTDFDRGYLITANNAGAQSYTMGNPSATGFGQNYFNALNVIGAGAVTENASGFTVNGGTSFLTPAGWLRWLWSDGVNYRAEAVPTLRAFPASCTTAITIVSGVFSCGAAGAVSSLTGDGGGTGGIFSNVASTGAVTLTLNTTTANKVWANCTGSTATPTYCLITDAMLTAASHAVLTNQANTMGAFLFDLSAGTTKIPTSAGCTASATAMICYDSTNKNWHIYDNNADAIGCAFSSTPITGDLVSVSVTSGQVLCSDSGTGNANVVTAASAATAAKQVCVSGGANKTCSYIDHPDIQIIPAANCNNITAGTGWSIGSGGSVSCRAGTNNKGAFISITDTASTFATFQTVIPEDWDSATNPFIRFQIASTDATNLHTIIPSIQIACYKGDGSTTDDVAPNAAHSLSTITLNGNANRFWSTSNVQMNATDMTGCVAGAMMQVTVGRATDTATSAQFYSATLTFPRLLTVQAN